MGWDPIEIGPLNIDSAEHSDLTIIVLLINDIRIKIAILGLI
jgi:hypothetical protein